MDLNRETAAPDSTPARFLLLFRHTGWDQGLSNAEAGAILDRVNAWFEDLARRGIARGGQPLLEGGRTVSSQGGRTVVTDGPFAESKEAVGGYLLLAASSLDEAVKIVESSPLLAVGVVTEVRELAVQCPILERLSANLPRPPKF